MQFVIAKGRRVGRHTIEWLIVVALACAICGVSFFLLRKSRVGRVILSFVTSVVLLPFVYVGIEFLLLCSLGRSIVPQVGILFGVFAPPPTYFKPLVSMPLEPDTLVYEGSFRCRHFGRHELNLEMERTEEINDIQIDLNFRMKYEITDEFGNVLASGCAKRGRQNPKSMFWPYVYCSGFDVPSQIPRNKSLKVRIEVSDGFRAFVKKTHCRRFVIMKVSDE